MSEHATPIPSQDDFDRMEQRLFEAIAASDKKHVFRKRLLASGAAVLILGVSATTWALLPTPETQHYSAYCYDAADTSSHYVQVDTHPNSR